MPLEGSSLLDLHPDGNGIARADQTLHLHAALSRKGKLGFPISLELRAG